MMCPISGDLIESWHHIEDDSVGTEWYEKDEKAREHQDQVHDFPEDFRIEAFSPNSQNGKLRIRVHCFVREGDWVNSEVCEVKNIETGQVFYSTDEESPEEIIQRLKAQSAKTEEE